MSWGAVATAIYAILSADTGGGGLVNVANPLVNSVVNGMPSKNATPPLVCFQSNGGVTDDVFDPANQTYEYGVQVDVYSRRSAGATAHETIVDRVKVLLRRISLTVTGWVNGAVFLDSEQPAIEEGDLLRTILIFRVHITDPS